MNDVALLLGPVAFGKLEVPATIDFGGTQRLVVHELPGGQGVIDQLGPVPVDIAWKGIFSGSDATARARVLDQLRVAGTVLALSWDVFFFPVVIRSFIAEYRTSAWIPYELSCTVAQDPAPAVTGALTTLIGDVVGDVASAAGFTDFGGLDLSSLQAEIGTSGAGNAGSAAAGAAGAALASSLAKAVAGRDQAGTALVGYGETLKAGGVTDMIGTAGQAAGLGVGAAYLSRAVANFSDAGL